jgi:serpin B
MKAYEVELSLPKFRSEFSTSLTGPLKEMGIKRAFSGKADFSGMSDESLCIDNVIQKTYICVDEEGAEAAAVTAISMSLTARPDKLDKRTLNLNRPFIYMITDITGDNILFMGKVGNPAE